VLRQPAVAKQLAVVLATAVAVEHGAGHPAAAHGDGHLDRRGGEFRVVVL
jgi:hypothetical protein